MSGFPNMAVIGGGNMAEAIVRGGLGAGVLDAARVVVCEPEGRRREVFAALGVRATAHHDESLSDAGLVLLAVKPQSLEEVGRQCRSALLDLKREPLVVSILAGVGTGSVAAALGFRGPVVRVMPNLAVQVGEGMTAISPGADASAADAALAERLFAAVGDVVQIDESLMDAFTALSGSGPAYVFALTEWMAAAGTRVGFDAETADRVVRKVVLGAARLLATSARSPKELRESVTSKGGTTAAAMAVLENAGVGEALARAIVAARDRGRELGR